MERFRFKVSYFSVHALARAVARPDFMWRVILSGMALVVSIISIISFISYMWASHAAPPVSSAARDRGGITLEEIRSIRELYIAKQERYKQLEQVVPKVPDLGGVYGVEGDIADVPT